MDKSSIRIQKASNELALFHRGLSSFTQFLVYALSLLGQKFGLYKHEVEESIRNIQRPFSLIFL